MDHIQKPICLGYSQLYRNQSAGEKGLRLGFRDWRNARMAGGNQQDRVDERGVWSFRTIRIEQRGVEGDGVNDEAPLVLKRKPHIEPSRRIVSATGHDDESARWTYNWLLSSSVITSGSCVRLGAGLSQLKLISSGGGEGEEWVNPVEYIEGEDDEVHNEYCCRGTVTLSGGSKAGLATPFRVGGRNEELVDEGVG